MTAEGMASRDRHHGESDDRGDFRIEGLPRDRMYEVRLEKRGIMPTSVTVFLSSDKDLGRIAASSWSSRCI